MITTLKFLGDHEDVDADQFFEIQNQLQNQRRHNRKLGKRNVRKDV